MALRRAARLDDRSTTRLRNVFIFISVVLLVVIVRHWTSSPSSDNNNRANSHGSGIAATEGSASPDDAGKAAKKAAKKAKSKAAKAKGMYTSYRTCVGSPDPILPRPGSLFDCAPSFHSAQCLFYYTASKPSQEPTHLPPAEGCDTGNPSIHQYIEEISGCNVLNTTPASSPPSSSSGASSSSPPSAPTPTWNPCLEDHLPHSFDPSAGQQDLFNNANYDDKDCTEHRNDAPLIRCGNLVIDDKFKFIYLDNVKAASTTIRRDVFKLFGGHNVSEMRSGHDKMSYALTGTQRRVSVSCKVSKGENNTVKLLKDDLERLKDYFIFSFVRNPLGRFFSSYVEAVAEVCKPFKGDEQTLVAAAETEELTRAALLDLSRGFKVNHHFLSQTKRLSSTDIHGNTFRPHFVGKVEEFPLGWKYVLETICSRHEKSGGTCPQGALDEIKLLALEVNGEPLPTPKPEEINEEQAENKSGHRHNEKDQDNMRSHRTHVETLETTRAICKFYLQDYECFDYPLPHECKDVTRW